MRSSLGTLAPMRRAFAFPRHGRSDLFGSRARLAVAGATGVTLTYLYFPFDRRVALDSGSPARRTRSIWVDDPPTEDKPTSSPDPKPRSTDGDESGEGEQVPGNEGAFNPETGEINWDCSCLGGMAHGPCGPEFREAFSCFVFSEKEPKGVDCVEKFKNMQDCFRRHPDVYGEELDDDGDAEDQGAPEAVVMEKDSRETSVSSSKNEPHPVTPSSSGTP